ncbi:class I lanthipeptide [Aquimarina sp. D1M17]|uniref:class I lanthipeptide n=1 Tax=Aquimarina acroporae TaxID=2937283 RepID=UPI0020BDB7C2|nr:class I lanthipeptide [Aquimarina acroporae]MCK8523553.1 class I lanthipeptide [Aquimarina acroporae]
MKRKNLNKISLNKTTITKLNDIEKTKIKGGLGPNNTQICIWTSGILSGDGCTEAIQ